MSIGGIGFRPAQTRCWRAVAAYRLWHRRVSASRVDAMGFTCAFFAGPPTGCAPKSAPESRAGDRGSHRRVKHVVDLFEGASPWLVPERPEADQSEHIPRSEIHESRAEHNQVRCRRLDEVAGPHD